MMPVLAHNLLESCELIARACDVFREKCVEGIAADAERAKELVERNIIVVTALVPKIGYDAAAKIAKASFATGRTVRAITLEMGLMSEEELDRSLDLFPMTEGGIVG